MDGSSRRNEIILKLKAANTPISGSSLAKEFNVSRQVIVTDIALLRASNYNIISTNRGYILIIDIISTKKRVLHVKHDDEHIQDELNTIVDCGGKVKNVMVDHELYGQVMAPLIINSRRDVLNYIERMQQSHCVTLKHLSNDEHYHTIEADSEELLDLIEKELDKKGYLIK